MFSAEDTRIALVATGVAAVVASLFRLLATSLSGPLLVAGRGGEPVEVTTGPVVVATALGGLAAWLLARLSARTRRPRRVFLSVVAVGLALSAIPPLAGTTTQTVSWLLGLHAAVAVCLVPPLVAVLPAARRSPDAPGQGAVPTAPEREPARDVSP